MKYLLVLLVVLAVIWFVRGAGARRGEGSARRGESPRTPRQPQDMVQCPVCGVHLPRADALAGPDGGMYCCAEHRQRAGA